MWLTLRRDVARGSVAGGLVLLRPVIEAMILVRWLEVSPKLHAEMYGAEDDRMRLMAGERWDELRQRRAWPSDGPVFAPSVASDMRAQIELVRRRAKDAGEPLSKEARRPLMPQVEQMALATGDSAVREAYDGLYRIVSPWTHFGGRSIVGHSLEQRADGTHLLVRASHTELEVRSIAAPSMAVMLASVSRQARVGIEGECKIIQDALTMWPAEISAPE